MKRKKSRTIITVLSILSVVLAAVVLVLLLGKGNAYYSLQEENTRTEEELLDRNSQIQDLTRDNSRLESEKKDLESQNAELETENEDLKKQLEAEETTEAETAVIPLAEEMSAPIAAYTPGVLVDPEIYKGIDRAVFEESYFWTYDLSDPEYQEVQEKIAKRIEGNSYNDNAKAELSELSYLKFLYYDGEFNVRVGEMLVNTKIAEQIKRGLISLFWDQVRLESADLPERFVNLVSRETGEDEAEADDESMLSESLREASRKAHNSYGFNVEYSRSNDNDTEIQMDESGEMQWSGHCYGTAVYLYYYSKDTSKTVKAYFPGLTPWPRNDGGYDLFLDVTETTASETTASETTASETTASETTASETTASESKEKAPAEPAENALAETTEDSSSDQTLEH